MERDCQTAVKVPKKIRQLCIWKDTLFVVTKGDGELLFSDSLQKGKVALRTHPSFKGCRVKKLAMGAEHLLVLSEEGVVFCIGDSPCGSHPVNGMRIVRSPLHQRVKSNDTVEDITVLKAFVDQGIRIEDVRCGDNHSLFLGCNHMY